MWLQATGAHDGELGAFRQARHHVDGADERGDGHEFVDVAGHLQQRHQRAVPHVVAVGGTAVHTPESVHEVKKEEQRQKGKGNEGGGAQHFAIHHAA